MSAAKTRQYAHLHAQLAQLNANLADTENLLRMTAVQAGDMRFLGGYMGALFMGSAKVLGEEGVRANADLDSRDGAVKKEEGSEEEWISIGIELGEFIEMGFWIGMGAWVDVDWKLVSYLVVILFLWTLLTLFTSIAPAEVFTSPLPPGHRVSGII
jgi:hypothetical protein